MADQNRPHRHWIATVPRKSAKNSEEKDRRQTSTIAERKRERERAIPSHAAIMAAAQVEETDEARWAKMPPRLRTRDQKHVLHNRTAVERGLHLFPPFKSMDEWTVKCLRCERDIDLWTWCDQKKIFILTARLELKCGGVSRRRALSCQKEWSGESDSCRIRTTKKQEANRNNWGVQPRRHIFFLCNPSNVGEVRCRRPQCWLYREPRNMTTWPTLQRAECRQTRTKNQHQVRAAGEIPPLEAEVRGTVPDELCSGTT